MCVHTCVRLFFALWTIAYQAPLGFSRQEYWQDPLFQGIFLTEGSNLHILHWQVASFTTVPPGKLLTWCMLIGPRRREAATAVDLLVRCLQARSWEISSTKSSGELHLDEIV